MTDIPNNGSKTASTTTIPISVNDDRGCASIAGSAPSVPGARRRHHMIAELTAINTKPTAVNNPSN